MRWLCLAVVVAVLSACSATPDATGGSTAALDETPVLTGQGIRLGSTPIPFGTPAAAAEETLRRAWGDPDAVRDWGDVRTDWGYCGGTTLRVLTWKGVKVLFSDVLGSPQLTGWRWDAPGGPTGAVVARDFSLESPAISYGDTLSSVSQAYPYAYAPPRKVNGEFTFSIWHTRMVRETPLLESGVVGVLSERGPDGKIAVAEAGSLCGF